MNVVKSILHNIGVVIVGFGFGYMGKGLDSLFGIHEFKPWLVSSLLLIVLGFLTRVWATYYFYREKMKVIVLVPQKHLVTTGPFHYSRNPLYLGGNVFIFLGAVLFFGSPMGIFLTVLNVVAVDFMIRREEKQLAQSFGEEWIRYKDSVRRWI